MKESKQFFGKLRRVSKKNNFLSTDSFKKEMDLASKRMAKEVMAGGKIRL